MSALQPGSQIGPYEILAPIGAGGMGEVYRSRDTKLKREVAIKVLPAEFSSDPERIRRFQREAEVLATLNHPHIAQIYGVEEAGGMLCLVLELVEGETLADRLKRGAMPAEDALEMARQIAEALEAAHERDIVHRDLKPANIKITPQGKVKVLDFGLAKAVGAEGIDQATSHSPTMMSGTVQGVILGTAAYMSPEQARGRTVDKRTDIWAFGCVLYEMLTGQQAFAGEDVTDVIARIVRGEPKWSALPPNTPAKIRQLLKRCLTKDPGRRLRDIGDGKIEIEEAGKTESEQEQRKRAPIGLAWLIAAAMALIAAVAVATVLRGPNSQSEIRNSQSMRFSISPPKGWRFLEAPTAQEIAISPDSKRLAFTVESEGGDYHYAIRVIDSLEAELVPGAGGTGPFWSPDSRYLGFFAGGKLKQIELSSGVVKVICDAPDPLWGTWGRDGTIILNIGGEGLSRVPATGGKREPLTALNPDRGEIGHVYPQFLDDRRFLYSVFRPPDEMPIHIGTLGSKDIKQISSSDSGVQYAAGHLFFIRAGKLMAQRLDERNLELTGEPVRLVEPVWVNPIANYPGYGVSSELIAFGSGTVPETQLVWVDRTGKEVGAIGTPDRYITVSLSPRQTHAAVTRFDPQSRSFDIWTIDLKSGSPSRFTFEPIFEGSPVWSPGGDSIAFRELTGAIKKRAANGGTQAETILKTTGNGWVTLSSWSKDGQQLAYTINTGAGIDVVLLPLSGEKKPVPLLHESHDEANAQISPDSKWMAYESNESGKPEIYVVSFPKPDGKWQISGNGGTKPKWRPDGKELFFLSPSSQLMAVDVNGEGSTFQKGVPKPLFKLPGPRNISSWLGYNYDVAQNGQRFLFNKILDTSEPPSITVISNWQALLK